MTPFKKVNMLFNTIKNVITLVIMVAGIIMVYEWSSTGLAIRAKLFL